jgi:hypothetical protein
MNANAVPSAHASSGGTVTHWEASPSPVSPRTRNEIGLSAERSTSWLSGARIFIHSRRRSSIGSPNSRATRSLRDCHSGFGFSHENADLGGTSASSISSW